MTTPLIVGDAVCQLSTNRILRVTQIDGDCVAVETPLGDTFCTSMGEVAKVDVTHLELSVAFCKVLDGVRWGGWNETIE